MANCPDCGTKMAGGTCPNCHEELYILTYQADDITMPVSDAFAKKAVEQQKAIDVRDQ